MTLKRARRRAPQVAKAKEMKRPTKPSGASAHLYASRPGATPKLITSASESSSTPKSLWVLVRRATRPSNPSKKMAKKMERAAL